MSSQSFDVAVIGAGAAGLCAAVHCAERGAEVISIERAPLAGGLVANLGAIDGLPIEGSLSGAAFAQTLAERCEARGVERRQAEVLSISSAAAGCVLSTDRGEIRARAVIVASGASLRRLGVPGEQDLAGRGVSQCDWCDGGFFRGEAVMVVGGGDAAFQAALHLARLCASVTIVMRGTTIRAQRHYVQAAADDARIEFLWDTTIARINGTDKVESVTLRDHAQGSVSERPISGVFVFAGLEPNVGFMPPEVPRDPAGRLLTDAQYRTAMPRVFAIGAVRSGHHGQIVSACGEGAAVAAEVIAQLGREDAA